MQMQTLYEKIQDQIALLDGRVGVVIKDLKTNRRIAIHAREIFDAASIIKLYVLVELLNCWQEGLLTLDEKIELQTKDLVGGCGVLKIMQPGILLTLHDLASLMICLSDNTATNILIERLGLKEINEAIYGMGLRKTRLARKLCIMIPGLYNYTTAQDTAVLLQSLISGQMLDQLRKDYAINLLSKQQLNNKIPDKLLFCPICKQRVEYEVNCPNCQTDLRRHDATGVQFAHKTGEIVGAEHDVGILFLTDRQVIISCFTGDLKNNEDGIRFQQQLGVYVYEYYKSLDHWD